MKQVPCSGHKYISCHRAELSRPVSRDLCTLGSRYPNFESYDPWIL